MTDIAQVSARRRNVSLSGEAETTFPLSEGSLPPYEIRRTYCVALDNQPPAK